MIAPDRSRRQPVDHALRLLTKSADHGRLWMGIAAVGVLAGKRTRRASTARACHPGRGEFRLERGDQAVDRPSPPGPGTYRLARRIGDLPWTSSFPSGHAASAAAFAAGATMEFPSAGVVLAPLAAAVAYSRVHVGVHYRSDVWAGAAVGLTAGRDRPETVAGQAVGSGADGGRRRRPRLPGGEGLTVIVNQASGSSDGVRRVHRQGVAEGAGRCEWDPDDRPGRAHRRRSRGARGGRRRRHRRHGRADRPRTRAAAGRVPGRHAEPLRQGARPGHRRAHGRRGRGGRRRHGRHGVHRRRRVPEHRQHRRLPGDGAPPGPLLRTSSANGRRPPTRCSARCGTRSRSTW